MTRQQTDDSFLFISTLQSKKVCTWFCVLLHQICNCYSYLFCIMIVYVIIIIQLFALADLIPIFTCKVSQQMTKGLWIYCTSPMFSKTCTSPFLPLPLSHPFFPSPTPISTKLIYNLKPSLIYQLSLVVLFSAVILHL